MKYELFCPECQIEAIIEVVDNPWGEGEDVVRTCFACKSPDIMVELVDED